MIHGVSENDPWYLVQYKIKEFLLQECLILSYELIRSTTFLFLGSAGTRGEVCKLVGQNGQRLLGRLWIGLWVSGQSA